VATVLGRPDYDVPLGEPVMRGPGEMSAVGHDSLHYLWRFEARTATLLALRDGAPGTVLGRLALPEGATGDTAAHCDLLRRAQARTREIQAAMVQVGETLLSLAGPTPKPELVSALHASRLRLGDDLLMFTDPAGDTAHAEFRLIPEVIAISGAPASVAERERIRPLAEGLLARHGALLGIEDPAGLVRLAAP
jgi:hypothetical protein